MQELKKPYWSFLEPVRRHIEKLAGEKHIEDIGGRNGNSPFENARTIGWEGSLGADLEEGLGAAVLPEEFAFCRHTLEDLANPGPLLEDLTAYHAGYIETPSPLAELTRGINDPSLEDMRGYIHHRWIVGVDKDSVLTFIPKYSVVDRIQLPEVENNRHILLEGPLHWNTYFSWDDEHGLEFRVLRHEQDFRVNDLQEYARILQELVKSTIEYTEANWWSVVDAGPVPPPLPEDALPRPLVPVQQVPQQVSPRLQPVAEPVSILFARFPGGGGDKDTVTDWYVRATLAAERDPRINAMFHWKLTDTPITMSRNRCLEKAKETGVDFVVMVDNDMAPDLYHPSVASAGAIDPRAKSFFESSFEFLWQRRVNGESPAVVGAPYCGPPPIENVYVFTWTNNETGRPEDAPGFKLEQYSREHACMLQGIQEVAALPTGLIIIDMKALDVIEPEYFYYEWNDETKSDKVSTEDVTFTRDLSLCGVPQFCNWDAWAGHWKMKCVGRPQPIHPSTIGRQLKNRFLSQFNIKSANERLVMVQPPPNGKPKEEPTVTVQED